MLRLAIDVMGGDNGPHSSLPAVAQALAEDPHLYLTLVGLREEIEPVFRRLPIPAERCDIQYASEIIRMDDKPSSVLRGKRDSSLWKAIELVAQGHAQGIVSAGNTGAMVALGRYLLDSIPGIDRPAICAPIPGRPHPTYLLDLGANVDCTPAELHQFAAMGSALVSVLHEVDRPKVALLNIGQELIKGNEQVKAAAALIGEDHRLNYAGFVEGHDLFNGVADVVVCDGFVGNVALKVCEGTASLIGEQLKSRFTRNWYGMLSGILARPLLKSFHKQIDPQLYNGAAMLGLRAVVVKSHGDSTEYSFLCAIRHAAQAVQNNLPNKIEQQLASTQ